MASASSEHGPQAESADTAPAILGSSTLTGEAAVRHWKAVHNLQVLFGKTEALSPDVLEAKARFWTSPLASSENWGE